MGINTVKDTETDDIVFNATCGCCQKEYEEIYEGISYFFDMDKLCDNLGDEGWIQDEEDLEWYCPNCYDVDNEDIATIYTEPQKRIQQ